MDELAKAQLPKVEEYCQANCLSNPQKIGNRWIAVDRQGNPAAIPFNAYKPEFPGLKNRQEPKHPS